MYYYAVVFNCSAKVEYASIVRGSPSIIQDGEDVIFVKYGIRVVQGRKVGSAGK